MKQLPSTDMAILGSGSIVTLFSEKNLINEYQIMIDPVILGKGTSIFKVIGRKLNLVLTTTRTFKSVTILLCYSIK